MLVHIPRYVESCHNVNFVFTPTQKIQNLQHDRARSNTPQTPNFYTDCAKVKHCNMFHFTICNEIMKSYKMKALGFFL